MDQLSWTKKLTLYGKNILAIALFTLLVAKHSASQSELQICSQTKNEILEKLLKKGKLDSIDQKKYVELNEGWKECIRGKSMPSFSAKSLNGDEINSENLKAKIIVVNFWFIGCPPCIAEMPALNNLVEEYKEKGVSFLGFTVESKRSLRKKIFPHYQFNFTIIPNAQKIETLFGTLEHPMTFIFDQNRKVAAAWSGGEVGEKAKSYPYLKIKGIIDRLLKAE